MLFRIIFFTHFILLVLISLLCFALSQILISIDEVSILILFFHDVEFVIEYVCLNTMLIFFIIIMIVIRESNKGLLSLFFIICGQGLLSLCEMPLLLFLFVLSLCSPIIAYYHAVISMPILYFISVSSYHRVQQPRTIELDDTPQNS